MRPFPFELDHQLLALVRNVQSAHAIVMGAVYVALQFWIRDGLAMRALDVFATLATAATAIALTAVPSFVAVDVSVVAFFVLFFVVRAAPVPSKPWVATLVAAASAIPFAFGLASMYACREGELRRKI